MIKNKSTVGHSAMRAAANVDALRLRTLLTWHQGAIQAAHPPPTPVDAQWWWEQRLGAALPLTRESRSDAIALTTSSNPYFDMETATLADFCLRPDETNHPSPASNTPANPCASMPGHHADRRKQRREPMYTDVVDVLATDAAGRKYGRRRCDDGAMYLGDFADDYLTARGRGMLVSLNGDAYRRISRRQTEWLRRDALRVGHEP